MNNDNAWKYVAVCFVMLAVSACAHSSGTDPHEMSAAQHEAAATREQEQGAAHAAQHDPNATMEQTECPSGERTVCWTKTVNPTAGHIKSSDEHTQLAAQHRAASQTLRTAEATACAGLRDQDRDTSPFAHTADIQGVTELKAQGPSYQGSTGTDGGATVVFRATKGLTVEWLQRIVNCHLARNAALGHDVPEMPYCPLVPNGVQAKVRSVGDGFAVDVTSKDPATAAEIWRRANQLTAAR
ncbi:MAG TPA: hypothetical protein VJV78_45945 [Polyangiales bacterium]|nr:hypothetical protein [Polyangiales bacterium]